MGKGPQWSPWLLNNRMWKKSRKLRGATKGTFEDRSKNYIKLELCVCKSVWSEIGEGLYRQANENEKP